MPSPEATSKAKQPGKGDGKGKGKKGDQKPKGPPPPSKAQPTPKAKASAETKGKPTVPCLFFPKGTYNRGADCPFAHGGTPAAKEKAKPSKAAPTAKATVATVMASSASQAAGSAVSNASVLGAALRSAFAPFRFLWSAFATISSVILPESGKSVCTDQGASLVPSSCKVGVPALLSSQHAMVAQDIAKGLYQLEWIAGSGAGRDLTLFQAVEAQGVPSSVFCKAISSEGSVRFETGHGHVTRDSIVHANGDQLGNASFCMLKMSPRSITMSACRCRSTLCVDAW